MADYEIHVVAEVLAPELHRALEELAYRRDDFRPGDRRIIRPYHLVHSAHSLRELDENWTTLLQMLSSAQREAFRGFAEAETTAQTERASYSLAPFRPEVRFPLERIEEIRCPIGKHKAFDLHIVADIATLDPRLDRILVSSKFYVVDIYTREQNLRRCYTLQPLDIDAAPYLFARLHRYLSESGGFKGKLKLERIHGFARFPDDVEVPPVIPRFTYIHEEMGMAK